MNKSRRLPCQDYGEPWSWNTDERIDEEEWNEMSEEAKEEAVKPIAFEKLDWGWKELP